MTIREAVARADLVICTITRWAAAAALLAALLLACLLAARALTRTEPPRTDRCDITSEGPKGDWTKAWDEWEDD